MTAHSIDYPKLMEHLPVGVTVLSGSLEIIYANPLALSILGLKYQEAVGRIVSDPQWILVDTQMNELPLEEYPAVRALSTKTAVSNIEFGVNRPRTDD